MKNKTVNFKVKLLLIFLLIINFTDYRASEKPNFITPGWSKNIVIYEANIRQYTPEGTFKAFEKHLPELKKMGVGIIWLMPVNPIGIINRKGTLGSYYSIMDYKKVNPEFGTINDLKILVAKIHSLHMFVIIDWVANHTAWDNVWTKSHSDFYKKDSLGKFVPPVKDWTDVIQLNYENKNLRHSMIDAMKYWIKQCNIDGFRCDVASMVPIDFWIEARKELSKTKDIFMLAEASEPNLHKAFDMTYNWPIKDMLNDIAKQKKKASDIIRYYDSEKKDFDKENYRMVFTSNHDENSWAGSEYERLGEGTEACAVLCETLPGMALIYNGQEAGMNKRLSFFEKDTIAWKANPMRNIFTVLDHLKFVNKALWNGSAGADIKFIDTKNDNVISFVRQKDSDRIFTVFNLSSNPQSIKLNSPDIRGKYSNLFEKKNTVFTEQVSFDLAPWSYKVFVNMK
jgi:cyclomaltodextrinase / maltogenic alpha-amylase / neopullulanase